MGVKADVQWCLSADDIFLTWGSDLQVFQTKQVPCSPDVPPNLGNIDLDY